MRTLAFFWIWCAAAVLALGRLWSSADRGLSDIGPLDAVALVVLVVATVVLGRVLFRLQQLRSR